MRKDTKAQIMTALTFAGSAGITLASNIVTGYFIGKWIDGELTSEPIGAIIGIFFGTIAGVWSLYRWILKEYLKG